MIKEPIAPNKLLLSLQKDSAKKPRKKVLPYGSRTNKFRSLQASNTGSLRGMKNNNDAIDDANEYGVPDSKSEERDGNERVGETKHPTTANEIGKLVYRSAKNSNNPRTTFFGNYLTKDYLEKRT